MSDLISSRLARLVAGLTPKAKQPNSSTVLNAWIAQAEDNLGPEARGGRLGWLVASSVAIAAVQRAVDADGRQLFLLKGRTWLQHRLNATARTTKDVDGLIRGDIDAFLTALDGALAEPWGPLTLRRGPVEVINTPTRVIQPRRFDLILALRGVTWRRIQFEISPDEAGIGDTFEAVEPAPLDRFGLPDVDTLVGIVMRFQIAQRLHAASDSHDPPTSVNDRPRDIPDLLLLRDLVRETARPRWPTSGTRPWRYSMPGLLKRSSSGTLLGTGRRSLSDIPTGSTTTGVPPPRPAPTSPSTKRSTRPTTGSPRSPPQADRRDETRAGEVASRVAAGTARLLVQRPP